MQKEKKQMMDFRYYAIPERTRMLTVQGEEWIQCFGDGVNEFHFHNHMEIGYCYWGQKIFADIVDFASKTPSNITGPYYYDARDALGDALSNITQSGMGVDEALDSAQETVEFTMNS